MSNDRNLVTRLNLLLMTSAAENAVGLDGPLYTAPSLRSGFLLDDVFARTMAAPSSAVVAGRDGEMAVFQSLLQRVQRRINEGFTFPTVDPELGNGRLLSAEWVNASVEAKTPYDIIVFLEGDLIL